MSDLWRLAFCLSNVSLTIEQQIINSLKKSSRPLIVFRKHFSGDSLAAALAMFLLLKKQGINAEIANDDFTLPAGYKFLPAKEQIKTKLDTLRQMVISIDLAKTKMEEFHYDVVDDQLKIYLSPQTGFFGPQDIKAAVGSWKYDTVIVLDSPDLDSLGKIYTDNREFFYERPIINLDYSPANENFGQMNLIDLTSGSTCGVIYNLIKFWDETLFDPDINTCLLTGIIDKTKSFKAGLINPQTLRLAGQLIENKARREEIVKNLYYNRDLGTLKLWGRILTRLKEHYNGKLVTATVGATDFAETKTTENNLTDIIDELISTIPGVDLIVLLWQKENNQINGLVKSLGAFDPVKALAAFNPGGNQDLTKLALAGTDLALAEMQILEEIKKTYQPKF